MAGGKLLARVGTGGLIEDRCALARRLAKVRTGNLEMGAKVIDVTNFRRVGVDAALAVLDDRIVVPRAFPKFIEHIEVFVRDFITVVVRNLALEAEIARGVRQVGRDNVPGDTTFRQVVERAHPARERKRGLISRRKRRAEAKIPCDRGHGGDDQERIVVRNLHGLTQGSLGAVAETVVGADHVGEKNAVERAVFKELGELSPIREIVEAMAVVARVDPEPVNDMAHAVHLKEIYVKLLRHRTHGFKKGQDCGCVCVSGADAVACSAW